MKITTLALFALTAPLLLSGCAAYSALDKLGSAYDAEDCSTSSWETTGLKKGQAKKDADDLVRLYKTYCKGGLAFNEPAFRKGYASGLKQYCNYSLGEEHAESTYSEKACASSTTYNAGYNSLPANSPWVKRRALVSRLESLSAEMTASVPGINAMAGPSTAKTKAQSDFIGKAWEFSDTFGELERLTKSKDVSSIRMLEITMPEAYDGFDDEGWMGADPLTVVASRMPQIEFGF